MSRPGLCDQGTGGMEPRCSTPRSPPLSRRDRRLLLIGGGHAHVEVVRRWSSGGEPGAVTLLDPSPRAAYSGMLPGLIAGHYRYDQAHIDLRRLCMKRGVVFAERRLARLDVEAHLVVDHTGERWPFDLLSLDTGSTPETGLVPGAREWATGAKPVPVFLSRWEAFLEHSRRRPAGARIVLVGGGAAGLELALAMRHRLRTERIAGAAVTLVADRLLPGAPSRARRFATRALRREGVAFERGRVTAVEKEAVRVSGGESLPADFIVWATAAAAPEWAASSGLRCNAAGFVEIDAHLRSTSHEFVFAAGDVATLTADPAPKSGVTAVRQGPILATNLARALRSAAPLVRFRPQHASLALISLGTRRAIATRGRWSTAGRWVWWWKDWIDRRFIERYTS